MTEERVHRRLAAILAADVVGYSRMMGADETGTLSRLNALHSELLHPKVSEYGGRIVKTTGDGTLIEFPSAVDAVQYAVDVQKTLYQRNVDIPEKERIEMRMGVNLGDIIVQGEDIFGDGVNVAARLEALADPGGICISDMVRVGVGNRLALEFTGLGEQSLKNIAEPVRVFRIELGGSETAKTEASGTDAMFRRPAVAVLPFQNMSGDPEQEYFADGLTEDIITTLALWRSFPVIARNSTFAYKGQTPDIRQVGRELGARYVIEGSVRKAANRVRVTAQLINAETGHHVWAERYDRDLEDIFELQDQLTQQIAATVTPELERTDHAYAVSKKPRNMTAWDYSQRGWALIYEYKKESDETARKMFEKSIELDPNYSRAYTGLASICLRGMRTQTGPERISLGNEAIAAAQRAVELDPTDSEAHQFLGVAFIWNRQFERGIAAEERAIQLNPSNPGAHASMGHQLAMAGRAEEGIPYLETALKLSPNDAHAAHYQSFMARTMLLARQNAGAVEWARRVVDMRPNVPEYQLILAACLGHAGEIEEARQALANCEQLHPGYSSNLENAHPLKLRSDLEYFRDGLSKAGWEG